MRKVYDTLDLTEAVLLKDHLVHNGIAASVMNRGATRRRGGIASEVWVADDAGDSNVRDLIRAFLEQQRNASDSSKSTWECPHCGEDNPGDFQQCWSCSREHAGAQR